MLKWSPRSIHSKNKELKQIKATINHKLAADIIVLEPTLHCSHAKTNHWFLSKLLIQMINYWSIFIKGEPVRAKAQHEQVQWRRSFISSSATSRSFIDAQSLVEMSQAPLTLDHFNVGRQQRRFLLNSNGTVSTVCPFIQMLWWILFLISVDFD